MSKEWAKGQKRKDYPGNSKKLKPGQLLDYVIQRHDATRRGTHRDFRVGGDNVGGMYSWALDTAGLPQEGERIPAIRTNLHTTEYKDWEGVIPPGRYGAGRVAKQEEGKMLVTKKDDEHISLTRADKKHPERYALVGKDDIKKWLLIRANMPTDPGAEKPHYKNIDKERLEKEIAAGGEVQPKIDGALNFLNLNHGRAEMLSHRLSKTTGKPVVQTERFFGGRPMVDLPKELHNSVLMTEVYGKHGDKAIPSQELSGILNSTVANALETQKTKGVDLQAMIFDIAKRHGKPVELPYEQRKKLMEAIINYLPKGKFHLPESAKGEEAKALVDKITSGKHLLTHEGVVVHPQHGDAMKHKLTEETDVHIRGMFPAEKGSKYEGKGVGGFQYSHEAGGPVAGNVGSGLTDEMRAMMHKDPESFIDRVAKIKSHEKFPSGKHRVPIFLGLHEDYPHEKAATEFIDIKPEPHAVGALQHGWNVVNNEIDKKLSPKRSYTQAVKEAADVALNKVPQLAKGLYGLATQETGPAGYATTPDYRTMARAVRLAAQQMAPYAQPAPVSTGSGPALPPS